MCSSNSWTLISSRECILNDLKQSNIYGCLHELCDSWKEIKWIIINWIRNIFTCVVIIDKFPDNDNWRKIFSNIFHRSNEDSWIRRNYLVWAYFNTITHALNFLIWKVSRWSSTCIEGNYINFINMFYSYFLYDSLLNLKSTITLFGEIHIISSLIDNRCIVNNTYLDIFPYSPFKLREPWELWLYLTYRIFILALWNLDF